MSSGITIDKLRFSWIFSIYMRKGQKTNKPSWNSNPIYNECPVCKKVFRTILAKVKIGKGKYCSRDCYLKEHSKNTWTKGICKGCGKEFRYVAHRKQICCSLSCNAKWKRVKKGDSKRKMMSCLQCGGKYKVFKKRLKEGRGKFCSRSCHSKWMSIHLVGEKSYSWKNGLTPLYRRIRTLSKYKEWRKKILKKDKKCVICGATDNLEVDHINSFKNIISQNNILNSNDANNCDELWSVDNGRVLCKKCHVNTDDYGWKSSNN